MLAYDPDFGGDILFGGRDAATNEFPNTWLFQNGAWSNLTSTLPGATVPGPLAGGDMAYDAADGYLVMCTVDLPATICTTFNSNTYELTASGWSQLSTSLAPPGRVAAQMVYDAAAGEIVLFGGRDPNFDFFSDTWVFHGGSWSELHPAHAPSARTTFSMSYYAPGGYVLLYGGCKATGCIGGTSDTWIFQNNGWTNVTGLSAIGPGPGSLSAGAFAYDASSGAALMNGGSLRTALGHPQETVRDLGVLLAAQLELHGQFADGAREQLRHLPDLGLRRSSPSTPTSTPDYRRTACRGTSAASPASSPWRATTRSPPP